MVIIFFFTTFNFYSSKKNIEDKHFNRNNIDEIINKKISDLPVLKNDTNVIEFNDGFSGVIKNEKPRSFGIFLNLNEKKSYYNKYQRL